MSAVVSSSSRPCKSGTSFKGHRLLRSGLHVLIASPTVSRHNRKVIQLGIVRISTGKSFIATNCPLTADAFMRSDGFGWSSTPVGHVAVRTNVHRLWVPKTPSDFKINKIRGAP